MLPTTCAEIQGLAWDRRGPRGSEIKPQVPTGFAQVLLWSTPGVSTTDPVRPDTHEEHTEGPRKHCPDLAHTALNCSARQILIQSNNKNALISPPLHSLLSLAHFQTSMSFFASDRIPKSQKLHGSSTLSPCPDTCLLFTPKRRLSL